MAEDTAPTDDVVMIGTFVPPDTDHVLGVGEHSEPYQLFIELPKQLSQAPTWLQYLPAPGTYKHPIYGDMTFSKERNQRFVDNFKAGVYQDRLPIDAEHETKLSGAFGWIIDMRQADDGSVEANVEWNDRGISAFDHNRYRYFSPEYYDTWPDSAGNKHKDVAIGGALTTRPFFKPTGAHGGALRPLVASESGYFTQEDEMDPKDPKRTGEPPTPPAPDPETPPGDPPTPTPQAFSELTAQNTALADQVKKLTEANTALSATNSSTTDQVKALSETVTTMQNDARKKRFTDEVMGKGPASQIRWFGEPAKNVATLEALAAAHGEDSDILKDHIATMRAAGDAVAKGETFRERGSGAGATADSAEGKLEAIAKQMTEKDPTLTIEQATVKAIQLNPELYTDARNAGMKRGA